MSVRAEITILCIASYFKGTEFIQECAKQDAKVLLLTAESLKDQPWPWDSIAHTYYIPGTLIDWDMRKTFEGIGGIYEEENIAGIVALDDFDVERAASLREEFRWKGLGETVVRRFRDKLVMRQHAHQCGIPVPHFTPLFHRPTIDAWAEHHAAPWVLKPRSSAAAYGIRKLHNKQELWDTINNGLSDRMSAYLLEQFRPGDVYHVDSLTYNGKVIFARAHRYLNTPMEVTHDGGIFRTQNVPYGSDDEQTLLTLNERVMTEFGMLSGASHTEFIKSKETGEFYFLETSARVGGANITDMLEASSGINLWREWAKMATLREGEVYVSKQPESAYSGIIVSLARQEWPDTSAYTDAEIVWRMKKKHHVGLIVKADSHERVTELLESYTPRFYQDFHASLKMEDTVPRD